jgi:hypothetical protein
MDNLGQPKVNDDVSTSQAAVVAEANFRRMVRTHASFDPHPCYCPRVCRNRKIVEDMSIAEDRLGRAWNVARREAVRHEEDEIEISSDALDLALNRDLGAYDSYQQHQRASRAFRPR